MNKDNQYSRRSVVISGIQLPSIFALGSILSACSDEDVVALCANPNNLSFSENSLRNANKYTEVSEDPEKTCLNCAFFTPGEPMETGEIPNCGVCDIWVGAASKNGYCESWAAKDVQQS